MQSILFHSLSQIHFFGKTKSKMLVNTNACIHKHCFLFVFMRAYQTACFEHSFFLIITWGINLNFFTVTFIRLPFVSRNFSNFVIWFTVFTPNCGCFVFSLWMCNRIDKAKSREKQRESDQNSWLRSHLT